MLGPGKKGWLTPAMVEAVLSWSILIYDTTLLWSRLLTRYTESRIYQLKKFLQ